MDHAFERLVALVLVLLGSHVLLRAMAAVALPGQRHMHGAEPPHPHMHLSVGGSGAHRPWYLFRAGRRPFVVGMLHGMAGSAALMLIVLAAIPSPLGGLLYIAVFGLGSTVGMLTLSGLIALPFVLTAQWSQRANTVIRVTAALASMALGAWLEYSQR